MVDELGKDPGDFQWWASIWIPAIAAVASVAVLIFSVVTSRQAKAQAKESEKARVKAEQDRRATEHAERMRTAFAAIFASVGELSEALLKPNRVNDPFVYPQDFRVLGDIAAARLASQTPAERRLLNRLRRFVIESREMSRYIRGNALTEVWRLVISWSESDEAHRDGTVFPRFDELAALTSDSPWPDWAEHG